jgi:predicted deacylase
MKISTLIIFITVLLGFVGNGYCIQDNLLDVEAINYFSSDYGEARRKFLDASRAAGAQVESFENHLEESEEASLFTDVALIGPNDADTILVLGSGIHGVEGFTGSAIQTGLLHEGLGSDLKPGMGIVMIHAINPYGFAHLRRFNENNIDLNRNFLDHSKPYPANPGYEELADVVSPKSISFWSNLRSIFKLFQYRLLNGKAELKKAISGGQYIDPQGVFYGGQNETWSNMTIRAITRRYLSKAKRVVVIDFHTGLGPYGNAEVILNEEKHSPSYKRAVEWWGDKAKTTASGESVSVHLDTTLKRAFSQMLPKTEVTAVTLEFGTYSELKVLWALRTENWLHNYGAREHPESNRIKTNLLRVFYPDDDIWKLKVWEQGQKLVEQVLTHI